MTPKKKAKELVNSFYQPLGHLKCGVNNTIMWGHAKQYALIAVDEILDVLVRIFESYEERKYWEQVKTEIEAL